MTTHDDEPLRFEDDEQLIPVGDELVDLLQSEGIRVSNVRTAEQWLYRFEVERHRAVRLGDVRAVLYRLARQKAEPRPPRRPNRRA